VTPLELAVPDEEVPLADEATADEVDAPAVWLDHGVPGIVFAVTIPSAATAPTEPKAMPVVMRLSKRKAASRSRILVCWVTGVWSMGQESGFRA